MQHALVLCWSSLCFNVCLTDMEVRQQSEVGN